MESEELLRYLLSFLGGGVTVALINWARTDRATRRELESEYLRSQLSRLYGPLYYFASQNEELGTLVTRLRSAYDEIRGKIIPREEEATKHLLYAYVDQVLQNQTRMCDLLEAHWYLLDEDDFGPLSQFQTHVTRARSELSPDRDFRTSIPIKVYSVVGPISSSHPDVLEIARTRVHEKRYRLSEIMGLSAMDRSRMGGGAAARQLKPSPNTSVETDAA